MSTGPRKFALIWEKMLDSTIWEEPPETRVVWLTMLLMKDEEGMVIGTAKLLQRKANVSKEAVELALNTFLLSDPHSRTPDNEGRRIEEVSNGWRILNHDKYQFSTEAKRLVWAADRKKAREKERLSKMEALQVPDKGTALAAVVKVSVERDAVSKADKKARRKANERGKSGGANSDVQKPADAKNNGGSDEAEARGLVRDGGQGGVGDGRFLQSRGVGMHAPRARESGEETGVEGSEPPTSDGSQVSNGEVGTEEEAPL